SYPHMIQFSLEGVHHVSSHEAGHHADDRHGAPSPVPAPKAKGRRRSTRNFTLSISMKVGRQCLGFRTDSTARFSPDTWMKQVRREAARPCCASSRRVDDYA